MDNRIQKHKITYYRARLPLHTNHIWPNHYITAQCFPYTQTTCYQIITSQRNVFNTHKPCPISIQNVVCEAERNHTAMGLHSVLFPHVSWVYTRIFPVYHHGLCLGREQPPLCAGLLQGQALAFLLMGDLVLLLSWLIPKCLSYFIDNNAYTATWIQVGTCGLSDTLLLPFQPRDLAGLCLHPNGATHCVHRWRAWVFIQVISIWVIILVK